MLLCLLSVLSYLLYWPTPINPLAWQAPQDQGFVGPFKANSALALIHRVDITPDQGPEALALDAKGQLYTGTESGNILRFSSDDKPQVWLNTGGRPLGMVFDGQGNLLVADGYLGLLSISPQGEQKVLSDRFNGTPLGLVDDVDVSNDGRIIFTDASAKFSAKALGGTMAASLLDIMAHGGHGRVFIYNPADQSTKLLAKGLNFANGVAVSFDNQSVLVNETGHYRVLKIGINQSNFGNTTVVVDNLPGFPDNITRAHNGRYWLGLIAPRNALLDSMSGLPLLRKVVQRLPAFLHPKAQRYGHVIAINEQGEVLRSLQDPQGSYASITGAVEIGDYLYLSSLDEAAIGRVIIER
ncbi:MAG: sugar lactone lactonase YvrE [Alteromonadaceae bacterium]|jgi:sugar lactone lactonase YvrE